MATSLYIIPWPLLALDLVLNLDVFGWGDGYLWEMGLDGEMGKIQVHQDWFEVARVNQHP